MTAAVVAALACYTLALVWACRRRWAHRCAECAYRHRPARHRAGQARPAVVDEFPTQPIRRVELPPV